MGRPPVTPESQLSEIIQFRLTPSERSVARKRRTDTYETVRMDTPMPPAFAKGQATGTLAERGGFDPARIDTDPSGRL